MRFLYFRAESNSSGTNPKALDGANLGYISEHGEPVSYRDSMVGPSGGAGCLFGLEKDWKDGALKYNKTTQEWCEIPHAPGFWVGHIVDEPKDPANLLSSKALAGVGVETTAGVFVVPIARKFDAETGEQSRALPGRWGIAKDGTWSDCGPATQYKELWEVATTFFNVYIDAATLGNPSIDDQEFISGVVLALSTNYRIGPAEISLLGVLDTQVINRVLKVIIDQDSMNLYQKKKAVERLLLNSNGSSGPKEETQDTPQPSQTLQTSTPTG